MPDLCLEQFAQCLQRFPAYAECTDGIVQFRKSTFVDPLWPACPLQCMPKAHIDHVVKHRMKQFVKWIDAAHYSCQWKTEHEQVG